MIKANRASLVQAEQFLRNRNWLVKSFTDVKEALGEIAAQPPNFLMICADIPGEKIRSLPKILSQAFTVPIIVYTEKNGSQAMRSVEDFKIKYKLFPPISGPTIERMILKMIKEANAANTVENTKASKKNYNFSSGNESDTISISGKKQSDVISISGKRQDDTVSVSGNNKGGKFNIVQKGKRGEKIDELISLSEEIDDEVKELKSKLKLTSDEFEQTDEIPNENFNANEDADENLNSDDFQNQILNADSSFETNEISSLENDDGLSGELETDFSNDEDRQLENSMELSNTENSDSLFAKNDSLEIDSANNSEDFSQSKDNSSLNDSNSQTPNFELSDSSTLSQANNSESLANSLANNSLSPEEIAELKKNAYGGITDSEDSASGFISKKRRLYKKSSILGNGQSNSSLDVLIQAIENSFEQLQGSTQDAEECELVENINHFYSFTINTDSYRGYLTIELSPSLNEDFDLIQILKSLILKELASLGLELKFDQAIEVSIQPIVAQDWLLQAPTFSRSRLYKTGEIIICYFENQEAVPVIENQTAGRMTINAHENIEAGPIGFNMFLFLQKNNKFIHYRKPTDTIPQRFVSQLLSSGIDKIYFLHKELELVKSSWVNLYFQSIKNQVSKKSEADLAA